MKKIAVFVEGQSELIFIRNYLYKMIDNSRLSFECVKLYEERMQKVKHSKFSSPNADYYFLIVDVGNDSRVTSAIKERANNLIRNGYSKVLGIRDMYCQEYDQRSPNKINEDISKQFIDASLKIINNMGNSQDIIIIFSIMELEAWFLGMYNIFEKIDARLSIDFIENKLNYNLKDIDPQNIFYRPSKELGSDIKFDRFEI